MNNFIQVHRGINRIRFLTLPLMRQVHWHLCPDGKRRPINCSLHNCILCKDFSPKNKLHTCIAYDYNKQGTVELYSKIFAEFRHIMEDVRQHDIKINVIEHMQKYDFQILDNTPQKIIKPHNDLLLDLANKVLPYTSEMVTEYLYQIDPDFKLSTITREAEPIYQRATDSALNVLKSENVIVSAYNKSLCGGFSMTLANGRSINANVLAARRLKSGELYSHAIDRDKKIGFFGKKSQRLNVILLVHEDGGFEFKPNISTIIKEAKLEGLLQ